MDAGKRKGVDLMLCIGDNKSNAYMFVAIGDGIRNEAPVPVKLRGLEPKSRRCGFGQVSEFVGESVGKVECHSLRRISMNGGRGQRITEADQTIHDFF
ncbi:hypothetical protein OSB04_001872 [Centaurea solstitialis]|uniref:Uncharacterized protein n=1 Tax=Centaurea solstitialis TaxID=347529 RepID=A0AA38U4F3_9ASTR|nr:hypothetical protein OSB04_001872 [Centaurea solstitialis]